MGLEPTAPAFLWQPLHGIQKIANAARLAVNFETYGTATTRTLSAPPGSAKMIVRSRRCGGRE